MNPIKVQSIKITRRAMITIVDMSGYERRLHCPYSGDDARCGMWCPLCLGTKAETKFSKEEAEEVKWFLRMKTHQWVERRTGRHILELCSRVRYVSDTLITENTE